MVYRHLWERSAGTRITRDSRRTVEGPGFLDANRAKNLKWIQPKDSTAEDAEDAMAAKAIVVCFGTPSRPPRPPRLGTQQFYFSRRRVRRPDASGCGILGAVG